MEVTVPVDVPLVGDERRKNWAKVVHGVDDSKDSGWAYLGEFIAVGGIQDVPVGSVLLVYGERGSRANPQISAQVFSVNGDGSLTGEAVARGRAWARTLRDRVVELLDRTDVAPDPLPWQGELTAYSDEALIDELRRRGYRTTRD